MKTLRWAAPFALLASSIILSGCLNKATKRSNSSAQTGGGTTTTTTPVDNREACLKLNAGDTLERITLKNGYLPFRPLSMTSDALGNVIAVGTGDLSAASHAWIVRRYNTNLTQETLDQVNDPTGIAQTVAVVGSTILVGGRLGADNKRVLRISSDAGKTWRTALSLNNDVAGIGEERVRAYPDGSLFYVSPPAVYRSVDSGNNWTALTIPNLTSAADVVSAQGSIAVVVGTFRAGDNSLHWVAKTSTDNTLTAWVDSDDFVPVGGVTYGPRTVWSDGAGGVYAPGFVNDGATTTYQVRRISPPYTAATWSGAPVTRQITLIDRSGAYYAQTDAEQPNADQRVYRSVDNGTTFVEVAKVDPVSAANSMSNARISLDPYGNLLLASESYSYTVSPAQVDTRVRRVGGHMQGLLSASCLYQNLPTDKTNTNVLAFEPQYALWSDGASKRRWIYLPPGTQINTADMDNWQYPVGTRVFKEFTRNGLKTETRLLVKAYPGTGMAAWRASTYKWNTPQTEATLSFDATTNALGTGHNVPNVTACTTCHRGASDVVLGFSALQLSKPDAITGVALIQTLANQGKLTNAPAGGVVAIQGTPIAKAAMGYLHGNCAHCHNPTGSCPTFNAKHNSNAVSMQTENAFINMVQVAGTNATTRLIPDDPVNSTVIVRMNSLVQGTRMPALGSSVVDTAGVQTITDWINEL